MMHYNIIMNTRDPLSNIWGARGPPPPPVPSPIYEVTITIKLQFALSNKKIIATLNNIISSSHIHFWQKNTS